MSGVRIPAGAPKKLPAFWRGVFFWLLPGSRSLSPIGEIPAGAPKNLLAFWRGDFFWSLPGSRSLSPLGEIPAGAPKNLPRLLAGDIFLGRSRGVEVYPRQGKSPLEHQKKKASNRSRLLAFSLFINGLLARQREKMFENERIFYVLNAGFEQKC